MSKLIGTNPNQVPSNADLGSAAYRDANEFLQAKGGNIAEIKSAISIGTTSAFLYDTTMDSDGGAWRKRCHHTSWYNQELNTNRRGSKREFPQIALITIEGEATLRIYDVTSGNPEMWMTSTQTDIYAFAARGVSSLYALNGMLIIGQNDSTGSQYDGIRVIDFIRDDGYWTWGNTGRPAYVPDSGLISGVLNSGTMPFPFLINAGSSIISDKIIDVNMRVMPNAPIDPKTKLPKPTVALATLSGVSVITHDGDVYDWSSLGQSSVTLTDDRLYIGYAGNGRVYVEPIPRYDVANYGGGLSEGSERHYHSSVAVEEAADDLYYVDVDSESIIYGKNISVLKENTFAVGTDGGLSIFDENSDKPNHGMVSWVGHDFNTGYQLGKCIFAAPCTTNSAPLKATVYTRNYVTNGTFDSDLTGWAADSNTGGTFSWNPAGYATITRGTGDSTYAMAQNISALSPGDHVRVSFSINPNNTGRMRVRLGGSKEEWFSTTLTANSWQTVEFTAVMDAGRIEIASNGGAGITSFSIDNVVINKIEPSHCFTARGLKTTGVLYKNHVARNSEMTSLTGFSDANYAKVPYFPELEFGTDDFTIMGWVKSYQSQDYRVLLSHGNNGANAETGWVLRTNTASRLEFRTDNGFKSYVSDTADAFLNGKWHHICITRRGGDLYVWIDGRLDYTYQNFDSDLTSPGGSLDMGYNGNDSLNITQAAFIGELSLFKISKTGIDHDQVSKVYEAERRFFVDDAKMTLYGDSNNVLSVSYDKATDLLHAGTTGGRSVFQDLSRVDYSEDGVYDYVYASNGYVAEE